MLEASKLDGIALGDADGAIGRSGSRVRRSSWGEGLWHNLAGDERDPRERSSGGAFSGAMRREERQTRRAGHDTSSARRAAIERGTFCPCAVHQRRQPTAVDAAGVEPRRPASGAGARERRYDRKRYAAVRAAGPPEDMSFSRLRPGAITVRMRNIVSGFCRSKGTAGSTPAWTTRS